MTQIDRPSAMPSAMHWARWGDPAKAHPVSESMRGLIEAFLGPLEDRPPVPRADVRLPEVGLEDAHLAALRGLVGDEHVHTDHDWRVARTRGKSTPDLLVREWGSLVAGTLGDPTSPAREDIVDSVVAVVTALRQDPLLRKIVEVDPEVLLPYLLQRRGRNQDQVLAVLGAAIAAGQEAGEVRRGVPGHLARGLLLSLQGPLLSVGTMTDETTTVEDLDRELRTLVDRYLAP